jgi:putative drug exporter of the RND superfamily
VLIVRMVIAPAVVTLLDDRAWWLPAWLDRVLPDVSLEGRSLNSVEVEPSVRRSSFKASPADGSR